MNKTLILSIMALLFLVACAQPAEKIKIGVTTVLTGPAAASGTWIKNGVELALEKLPEADRANVDVIFEDDQCKADTGLTVAHKFVEIDNLKFVIGPLCGGVATPTMQFYEDNKVLRIMPTLGLESNIGKGKYYFLSLGSGESMMKTLASSAFDSNISTVAVLFDDGDYGRDSLKWFEKYFTEKGGKVVAKEPFVRGTTDFRTQLAKIKVANPDAVFIASFGQTLVNILKQMKELGIETRKLSLINTEDTDVVKSVPDLIEGALYPSVIDSTTSDVKAWFQQRYLEKFGAPPEAIATDSFDALNVLYSAIKSCKQDVECVKQTITQTGYVGAGGTVSFDQKGVGIRNPVIKTVKNGKFVFVE